jgi:hypothetical protein
MVVHLFLNNNKALDFLPINSIKNGGITGGFAHDALTLSGAARALNDAGNSHQVGRLLDMLWLDALGAVEEQACDLASIVYSETIKQ